MKRKPIRNQAREFDTVARRRVTGLLAARRTRGMPLATNDKKDVAWLRRHMTGMGLIEPEPHVFFHQEDWNAMDTGNRAKALVKGLSEVRPGLAFWGFDAALIWGLEVPFDLLSDRYIVANNAPGTLSAPVHLLRKDDAGRLERHDGVSVTEFWKTVETCLLRAPFSFGLALADSALRKTGETASDLTRRLEASASTRYGYRQALAIACYADGRSENGGESRFRAFFIAYGFEVPELQVEFADPLENGRTFRVDYLWHRADGTRLIGELDGMDKYRASETGDTEETLRRFSEERQRESRLTLLGFPVLRFSFGELKNPAALAEKMKTAGVPWSDVRATSWSEQWCGKRRQRQ